MHIHSNQLSRWRKFLFILKGYDVIIKKKQKNYYIKFGKGRKKGEVVEFFIQDGERSSIQISLRPTRYFAG